MMKFPCRLSLAGHIFGWLLAAPTHAFTLSELQQLLKSSPRIDIPFQEVRESPWLSAPAQSRGTMRASAKALEKRVELPRPETWRLLADRIEWTGNNGVDRKEILFAQAPAMAVLADAIRRIINGDLDALQTDFRVLLSGDQKRWAVQLIPISVPASQHLDLLEMQGTGAQLQSLVVNDRQGARTTTSFRP